MPKIKNISKTFLQAITMTSTCLIILLVAFWFINSYFYLNNELKKIEKDFIAREKIIVKNRIINVINNIKENIDSTFDKTKNIAKSQVELVVNILKTVNKVDKNKSIQEKKHLFREIIHNVKIENKNEYCFAITQGGVIIANINAPNLIDKNALHLKDINGFSFVKEFIKVANENPNGGFVEYYFYKKDDRSKAYKKISFVKYVKSLDLIIGSSIYMADVENEVKEKTLKNIAKQRWGKDGYVFINNYDGITKAHYKENKIGKNRIHIKDVNGVKIIEELINFSKGEKGGFIEYIGTVNPKTGKAARKFAYANGIDQLQWSVGSGFYFDKLNEFVIAKKKGIQEELYFNLIIAIVLVSLSFFFSLFFAKKVSYNIKANFDLFIKSYKDAGAEHKMVNTDKINIVEFKELAHTANYMINAQIADREKLIEKDNELERLVEERTYELQFITNQWENTFNSINDMIIIVDKEHNIIRLNLKAEEFQKSLHLEDNSKCFSFVYGTNVSPNNCKSCPMLSDISIEASEEEFFDERTSSWFYMTASQIFSKNGKIEGVVHIMRDITEQKLHKLKQKEIEKELAHSEKMIAIGTLAGGIAHDFNNILMGIAGFIDITNKSLDDKNKTTLNLSKIKGLTQRATDLVSQILQFSRKDIAQVATIQPKSFIKENLNMIKATFPATIQIDSDIVAENYINVDPTHLQQILLNLATNAKDAMNNVGALNISLYDITIKEENLELSPDLKVGDYVMLEVADTGTGIPENIIDKIFDPFFTTKDRDKGTGLGLATIYGLMNNYGGAININTTEGVFTKFYLFFPTVPPLAQVAEKESVAQVANSYTGAVMVIDDEDIILEIYKFIFEGLGFTVCAFENPLEAIEDFNKNSEKYRLIFSDMTMPHLNGFEVLNACKQIRKDIPFIICSGHNDLLLKNDITKKDIVGVLTKPANPDDIKKIVAKALASFILCIKLLYTFG